MKFSCEKKILADAVAGVLRAVPSASSVPVLQGILFKAEGFVLELRGYDLEMAITTQITANVIQPGEVVLPAKLVNDMIRSMSSDEVNIECEENMSTKITGGITEYNLMGMSSSEFPSLPTPGADFAFEIDAAELENMIGMTLYATSTDDKKPALTGELFDISPGNLTIVALDGFRVAITNHPVVADKTLSIVVPGKTVSEAARLLGSSEKPVRVDANNRYIVFSDGTYTVMSRLIEGEFFNYKAAIPKEYKTRVEASVPDFEKAVERCAVIITERLKNPLRITFSENIEIKCQTPLGSVNDCVDAQVEGESVEVGFNYRYLLDALRNSGTDRVIIELSGQLSPVKILPLEGDEFTFVILPVRFKND